MRPLDAAAVNQHVALRRTAKGYTCMNATGAKATRRKVTSVAATTPGGRSRTSRPPAAAGTIVLNVLNVLMIASSYILHLHEAVDAEGRLLGGLFPGRFRAGAEIGKESAPGLGQVDERLERGVEGVGVDRQER